MKKGLVLLLIGLTATSTFIGCGQAATTDSNENDVKVENSVDTEANSVVADSSETIQSAPGYAITSVEADGYDYYQGRLECLQITDDNHPLLATAIDEFFSASAKDFNADIESLNEEAKEENEEYEANAQEEGYEYDPIKYESNITVDVTRCDSKILSFVIDSYTYYGGAHGGNSYSGYTFDVNTGKRLAFSDFGDADTLSYISKKFILDTIEESEQGARDALYNDDVISYKAVIDEKFSNDSTPEFVVDYRGITFMFQQYDIAPYAAGLIDFTVPFSKLTGFDENYIPDDEFYTSDLSTAGFVEYLDFDGADDLKRVYLLNEYSDEGDASYKLHVGDESASHQLGQYGYAYGTYIHSKEGNFILVSEGDAISLYEISNGIKEIGTVNTEKSVKEISEGKIVIATRTYDEYYNFIWSDEETFEYTKNSLQ